MVRLATDRLRAAVSRRPLAVLHGLKLADAYGLVALAAFLGMRFGLRSRWAQSLWRR